MSLTIQLGLVQHVVDFGLLVEFRLILRIKYDILPIILSLVFSLVRSSAISHGYGDRPVVAHINWLDYSLANQINLNLVLDGLRGSLYVSSLRERLLRPDLRSGQREPDPTGIQL